MIVAILVYSDLKKIALYNDILRYSNLKAKKLGLFLIKTIVYSLKNNT